MTPLAVRPASAADAPAAAALMRASIATLCTADHAGDPAAIARWCANKTPETVARWIADPGLVVLVAEDSGLLAVAAAARPTAEILLNYVAPDARFRGASAALLAALERRLAAEGHREGRLESTLTDHRFYLAQGWRDADTSTAPPGRPMLKRLGPR
jgi:GNAT superfamily N-acetyltransferase